jgi:hypothetical protein
LNLLFLSSLVKGPAFLRRRDILLLPLLGTAANQNDDAVTVLAKVGAVAWAEVDLVFEDT